MKINIHRKIALFRKSPKTALNVLSDKIFNIERNRFPRIIDIFVTERCNFSCPMCHIGESMLKNYSGQDLNFKYLQKIVWESKKWSPSFQITGGEPTLYKYLIDTLNLISSNKMICGLTTNGFLLESMAKDLVESGLNFLAVSLDGWNEESQRERGTIDSSFEKIIKGIQEVIVKRGKNIFPIIRIATVITKNNYKDLDKIGDVVKKIGIDKWSISNYYFVTEDIIKKNEIFLKKTGIGNDIWADKIGNISYFVKEEIKDLEEMLKTVKNEYEKYVEIDNNWPLNLKDFYSNKFPIRSSRCILPYNELIIRGNEDIELCQGYKLGNVKTDSIYGVWNGDRIRYFRNIFKSNGLMPACFRCCALDIKF